MGGCGVKDCRENVLGVFDVTSFVSGGQCEWIRRRGVFRSPGRVLDGLPDGNRPLGGAGGSWGGTWEPVGVCVERARLGLVLRRGRGRPVMTAADGWRRAGWGRRGTVFGVAGSFRRPRRARRRMIGAGR